MRPEKTMHRAEHRVEDIAIEAGKAHSLLLDTVFHYAFGRFLLFLSWLAVAILGVVTESPPISQWIIGLSEAPLSTQRIAGRFRRPSIKGASAQT